MIPADEVEAVIDGRRPPTYVIEHAVAVGARSPCVKSKRGAALYDMELAERSLSEGRPLGSSVIAADGFNGPPPRFKCEAGEWCRASCGKVCLHAEERAIRAAGRIDTLERLALVHVKVVDGQLVPGGGPSCWQCSRLVVESGVRGVWLYIETGGLAMGDGRGNVQSVAIGAWRFYPADEFHIATAMHPENKLPVVYEGED